MKTELKILRIGGGAGYSGDRIEPALELAEHGEYLAGDFTLADVAFAPGLQMLAQTGVPIDASLKNVAAWKTRLLARPSVVKAGR